MNVLFSSVIDPPTAALPRNWIEREEDDTLTLEERHTSWLQLVAKFDALFRRHVYENPEADEFDFRQHRQALYRLLQSGEELALRFLALSATAAESSRASVESIDRQLDKLRCVLHSWHGPLDEQKDVPDSFREGLRDFAEGRTAEMETALHEAPATIGS